MKSQTVDEFVVEMENFSDDSFEDVIEEALNRCMPTVIEGIKANFTEASDPDNNFWPPRKEEGDGHPLLIQSGRLVDAATGGHIKEVIGDTLRVGVNMGAGGGGIPGAAVHNFGYAIMNIPQREFMGLKEKYVDTCEELFTEVIVGAFT